MFRHIARRPTSIPAVAALAVALAIGLGTPAGAATTPTEQTDGSSAAVYSGPAASANARFVVDRYQVLLGRLPESGGLDFHLARLASGGERTRRSFVYSMLFSIEGSRREVDRAYDDLLDRAAEPEGRSYWTNHLQGHGVLDLRVLLLSSDEYRNRAGATDQGWIEALYLDVLGRGSDPSGRAYWLGRAGSGVPRPMIAAAIYSSDEALGRRASAHYQEVLQRNPTGTERAAAVTTIRRIGERGLRAELLASDEAFEPFLQAALS
jgi:hypothetical protein